MKLTVSELAKQIEADVINDGFVEIDSVGPVKTAGKSTVTFITDAKHRIELENSQAGAVITDRYIENLPKPHLIVKDVRLALIEVMKLFAPKLKAAVEGIDSTAKIGQDVKIAQGVSIGANVVISDGVEIGENTAIDANCKIGQNSKIGKDCRLDCNVVIYHNCTIGNNVNIQANSTIGSTGFGYYLIDGTHRLIPHNGGVIIEDFVDIGANCCVDRAKFGNTVIGAGTKIDNLVQIAHNVVIGKCCLIAGQVGIAGSSKLGDGVVLAGQVGVTDNIEIADRVVVAARSGVTHNIKSGLQLFGMPAMEKNDAFRVVALTRRLPKLAAQLKQLSNRIEKLEGRVKFHTRPKWAVGVAAAVAAVILIGFFISPYARAFFDPHEHEVEQVVKEYQDGNDHFYVSASSHFEDLHTGGGLFIIIDVAEALERILVDHAQMKDSFFLISYKDLDKLRKTAAWGRLSFVSEVDIEGQEFVLLTTETNIATGKPTV